MRVVERSGAVEESEFELVCSTTPAHLGSGRSKAIREECIRDGQRYRYGGMFLVPIDSSQHVVQMDLEDAHAQPRVLNGP
jgi:hypothetical protein